MAVVLAAAGLLLTGVSARTHRWSPPPAPPASAARPAQWPEPRADIRMARPLITAPMSRSRPVTVSIPAIRVSARIVALGLTAGGAVAVPSLGTPFLAGWYKGGAAPGQIGPAVLLGHVDSAAVGPAVFYRLGDLRPGDLVDVTRRDHRTAVFRVTSVATYPESGFPTRQVYGFTPVPTLRLITCGGRFDQKTHLYLARVIAFATYIGQEATS